MNSNIFLSLINLKKLIKNTSKPVYKQKNLHTPKRTGVIKHHKNYYETQHHKHIKKQIQRSECSTFKYTRAFSYT